MEEKIEVEKTVSEKVCLIVGSGKLGLPLIQNLKATIDQYKFIGTTTSAEKLQQLQKLDIDAIQFHNEFAPLQSHQFQVVIYTLPPGANQNIEWFKQLISIFPTDIKFIFISSTSVFGKGQGHVKESSVPSPEGPNGQFILAQEQAVKERFSNSIILRLGGLIRGESHPLFYISQKRVPTPNAYTHLVKQSDVIHFIQLLFRLHIKGPQIFHLLDQIQMNKKDYYQKMSQIYQMAPPLWDNDLADRPTMIDNQKSKMLGFTYSSILAK